MSLNRFEINQTYLNPASPPVSALSLPSLPAGPTPRWSHTSASPPLLFLTGTHPPAFLLSTAQCAPAACPAPPLPGRCRSQPRAPHRAKLPFIVPLVGSLLRFKQEHRSAPRHGLLPRRSVPPPNIVSGCPSWSHTSLSFAPVPLFPR
jgi:hypothetical protein